MLQPELLTEPFLLRGKHGKDLHVPTAPVSERRSSGWKHSAHVTEGSEAERVSSRTTVTNRAAGTRSVRGSFELFPVRKVTVKAQTRLCLEDASGFMKPRTESEVWRWSQQQRANLICDHNTCSFLEVMTSSLWPAGGSLTDPRDKGSRIKLSCFLLNWTAGLNTASWSLPASIFNVFC